MTTSNPARKRWVAIALCLIVACAGAVILKGSWLLWKLPWLTQRFYHHGLRLVTVTSGLATPWSLAFLPDGSMLVTEREGRLRRIEPQGGAGQVVSGLPPVWAEGEGGLLGVVIDPGFASNGLIYWTYAEPAPLPADGGSLAVARGHLVGTALSDVKVIFRDSAPHADPRDFGGRLVFGADGRLFVTIGERAVPEDAQKLSSPRGKVIRIDSDGNAPSDNPFVGTAGANPAIWALGFRDPQGIALDTRSGRLWAGDHGPAGGDELNIIVRGHNYGWPVISYGVDEGTGKQIGEGHAEAWLGPAGRVVGQSRRGGCPANRDDLSDQ